ncbi:MAG: Transcriptional regulatory protein QseF [Alphaproteobacteria bacterium MarineAlpha9_Bin4]|nr:AAA family ATPase [Pelagibacterales bacterium]PPR26879.1 MAG: Transcriptional regulatory protein QseF [Alphaproteobacteria bacterium MarineAlpha9_Bin4]|tara:strand:+ start:1 stop:1158 length:1158 start_codon:yes stop_codon:yes gene_type:complete
MTKVSIIKESIKELDFIKNKLEERDADVQVLDNLDKLTANNTCTLICHSDALKQYGEDSKSLLGLARNLKIKKIILIEGYNENFQLKKELGNSLIKLNLIENDTYSLETVLNFSLDDQKFVTGSKESLLLKSLAKKVASTDVTVFINGPTGTGKEVVANYIHDQSPRKDKPFIAVNCAAIPENMLEAILFGHEKGSFTGASHSNKGIFRAADNGTLLLDEISEMPLSLQAKLLRVLQEKKLTPVGGNREVEINVRIIATTNRNMAEEVKKNNFREDLYYRLNVFPIKTFGLSERIDDIIPIVVSIIKKNNVENKDFPYLSKKAQDVLKKHNWSGNVRELENVILRSIVLSNSININEEHILVDDSVQNYNEYYQQLEEKIFALGN